MKQKSIESLFLDICDQARWNGLVKVGLLSSCRRTKDNLWMQPGYFYNKLPEDVKNRIKEELKSKHAQVPLMSELLCGQITPWWEVKPDYRKDKEAFELELMKHGWKPDFRHKI